LIRIICNHGFYRFFPQHADEIALFNSYFDSSLALSKDFYTFPELKEFPEYSLAGLPLGVIPAVKSCEGRPWEILKSNGMVYNIGASAITLKEAITFVTKLELSGYYFLTQQPMIQAGALLTNGQRVLSFDAYLDLSFKRLKILGFNNE